MYEESLDHSLHELIDFVETVAHDRGDAPWTFGSGDGYRQALGFDNPERLAKIIEAIEFVEDVRTGRRARWQLEEAFRSQDFTFLTTNILQWRLLQEYIAYPATYEQYVSINPNIPDFRQVKMTAVDGLDTPLKQIGEMQDYPQDKLGERNYTYAVQKYGRSFGISWETRVNDFLGALERMPQRLAVGAKNTEQQFVTGLYANSTSLYNTGNKNIAAAGSQLSILNIEAAYAAMTSQKSESGVPIWVEPKYLVVPPQLELIARNILSSGQLFAVDRANSAINFRTDVNVLPGLGIEVVRNPWINLADPTNGSKSWYLFADPNMGQAIEVGFLAGHRDPELTIKLSNHRFLTGGGTVPEEMGDFESDAVRWRVRHIFGGTVVNPKFTYGYIGN